MVSPKINCLFGIHTGLYIVIDGEQLNHLINTSFSSPIRDLGKRLKYVLATMSSDLHSIFPC